MEYDGNRRLTRPVEPTRFNHVTTYAYDAANQMTAANGDTYAQNPSGHKFAFPATVRMDNFNLEKLNTKNIN